MEPLVTLARFSRYMNKVYIPLDDEEELEVVRILYTGEVGGMNS